MREYTVWQFSSVLLGKTVNRFTVYASVTPFFFCTQRPNNGNVYKLREKAPPQPPNVVIVFVEYIGERNLSTSTALVVVVVTLLVREEVRTSVPFPRSTPAAVQEENGGILFFCSCHFPFTLLSAHSSGHAVKETRKQYAVSYLLPTSK